MTGLLLLALALPTDIAATAAADRPAARLSDVVAVTLTVTGPAPLRVETAANPLDEPSALVWQVRPAEPPTVTEPAPGRQRWERRFLAEPFSVGHPLRLGFAPVRVTVGADPPRELAGPAVEVRVTAAASSDAEVRSITGVEVPPPPVTAPASTKRWALMASVAAVAVGWLAVRRFGRNAVPPGPSVAAQLAVAAVELERGGDPRAAVELADAVVRRTLQRRAGLADGQRTTAELLAGCADTPAVAYILQECDAIRFGGRPVTADEARALLAAAAEFADRPAFMSNG